MKEDKQMFMDLTHVPWSPLARRIQTNSFDKPKVCEKMVLRWESVEVQAM
jgi:hypothetical protein